MRFVASIFVFSALLLSQTVPGSSAPNQSAPDFTDARHFMQQGNCDQAIAQLQELSAKDPGLKGLPHELGIAYYKKGDYIKAMDSLKAAIEQDPHDNEAVQLLGLSYYLSGRPADAIPLLEKVQTWYPRATVDATSTGPYILMGKVLEKKGEPELAVRSLRHALAMDPNNPITHHLLGQAYRDLGNTEEAERELKTAQQLGAKDDANP